MIKTKNRATAEAYDMLLPTAKSTLYAARAPGNELTDSVEPAGASAVYLPENKMATLAVSEIKMEDVSQVLKL